jgi:two-component sensor histidine kinase
MGKAQRVLVVDDDHRNLTIFKQILESLGYETILCSSGAEALARLGDDVDLVLLDIMMPIMDGYEVAKRIRQHPEFGDIPIIVVTILDSKEDRLRAVESGANDFISKPIDKLELRVRVSSLLKVKHAQDRMKTSLREKDILLREIHHRVKNNLAIVSSLLRLQSRYAADEFHRKMFLDTQNRIRAMALAHEKLYQTEKLVGLRMGEYIASLLDHLVISSKTLGRSIRLTKEIEEVSFGLETVVPIGIIVTELVSNCLQHAFPDGWDGEIKVALKSLPDEKFLLAVSDNGVGIPGPLNLADPHSFGLGLVRIFAQQIGGKMEIQSTNGTEFTMEFREVRARAWGGA